MQRTRLFLAAATAAALAFSHGAFALELAQPD